MAKEEAPAVKGLEKLHKIKSSKVKSAENIALFPNGSLAVADSNVVQTFDKNGKYTKPLISGVKPSGIATSHSGLLALTQGYGKKSGVRLYSENGDMMSEWGQDAIWTPHAVACSNRGQMIVSDIYERRHSVGVYTMEGRLLLKFGNKGTGVKEFMNPLYACSDVYDRIIISDMGNNLVKVFTREGDHLFNIGKNQLSRPRGVCCDSQGNIMVCDTGNRRISVFSPNGKFLQNLLTKKDGLASPRDILFSRDGKIFVSNHSTMSGNFHKIRCYSIPST